MNLFAIKFMIKFLRTNFHGDPNIGLYGFATDKYCLLGLDLPLRIAERIYEILRVNVKIIKISGTEFVGLFTAGNRNGIVLPSIVDKEEIRPLKKIGLDVTVLKSKETALGNLILCNDSGAIISSRLRKFKKDISDCLDCETEVGSIAGLNIVGSAAVTSNFGCLCYRSAKESEIKKIEDVLKVKADVGSVGGSPFVKGGIIVNGTGIIASESATGPELDRMQEVFTPKLI